tara:strand:+ start:373 stop:4056 length:3684 start_codon:yes stop_codon:yes gene_type:complete
MSEGFNVGNNINNVSNIIGMNIFLDPSQPDFQSINVPQELPWMRAGMEGERKISRRIYTKMFGTGRQRKKLTQDFKTYFKKKVKGGNVPLSYIKVLRANKWIYNLQTKKFTKSGKLSSAIKKKTYIDDIFLRPLVSNFGNIRQTNLFNANNISTGLKRISINFSATNGTTNIDYMTQVIFQTLRQRLEFDKDYEIVFRYATRTGSATAFTSLKNPEGALDWSAFSSKDKIADYLYEAFDRLTQSLHNSDPEISENFLTIYKVDTMIIGIRELGGGCLDNSSVKKTIVNNVFLKDYRSRNNNCLISIFKKVNENDDNYKYIRADTIRTQLLIPIGIRLPFYCSKKIAKFFKTNITIYKWEYDKLKEVFKSEYEYEKRIYVLFNNNHYTHIINKDYNTNTIKCKYCKKKLLSCNYAKHTCNVDNITFVNKIKKDRLGKQRLKVYHPEIRVVKKGIPQRKGNRKFNNKMKNKKGNFDLYPKHNLVFDLETFFCPNLQRSIAYACGCYYIEEERYFDFYGKECMNDFMNWIYKKNEEKIVFNLITYNGSGFDNFFVYKWLIAKKEEKYEPEVLMNGGRLLSLRFNRNESFDVYLFLNPNSLDACVKGFKITEVAKGVFPHNFPKKWEDMYYIGDKLDLDNYPKKMRKLLEDGTYKQKEIFDFKGECLEYLRSDVLATYEVFNHLKKEMTNIIGGDCRAFITLSQMSYDYNATLLGAKDFLELPFNKKKYEFINKSIYGGRTTPIKLRFENNWIKQQLAICVNDKETNDLMNLIKRKHTEFNKRIKGGEDFYELFDEYKKYQYLMPFDVKSLYPTTYEYSFPMEESIYFENMEQYNKLREEHLFKIGSFYGRVEFKGGKRRIHPCNHLFGIFCVDIDFIPNHLIPVLPQKNEKGNTCWDLICRENQFYNTIDLEEAEKRGYRFTIKRGFVYTFGKNFLQPFVNKVYAKKKKQDTYKNSQIETEKEKYNPALRMCLKIILNSLYGKFIQRPIFESSVLVSNEKELNAFYKEHNWTDFEEIGDNKILLMGLKKEFEGLCKKPLQVGSFILGYSRRIMNDYMDLFDEERFGDQIKSKQNSFYYTDTDCLWVSSLYAHKLEGKIGEELGEMEDELEGGICYDSYFICPKCYCAEYLLYDERSEKYKIKFKMRAKGHPSHCLTPQMFKDVWNNGTVKTDKFTMMKKIRHKLNAPQKEKGYQPYTIVLEETQRSINKETWKGRSRDGIMTYPIGYSLD